MEAVEIQVERGSRVSSLAADLIESHECGFGISIVGSVDPEPTADRLSSEAVDGWEIGALGVLLPAGADTVSGVDERRVARVRAVLAALEAAR